MPRPRRIYLENCLYYITSISSYEGYGRSLFYDREDYRNYLDLLARYKREFGFKLFGFALLPDRLQLLVELRNDVTISTIMHALNSTYTKNYNSRYGKKGHLFQERFRAVLVDKESYLLRLTAHIHSLPMRIGLAKELSQYPYTSNAHYQGTAVGALDLSEEVGELFGCLTGYDKVLEYERYCAFFCKKNRETESFEKLLSRKRVVGSRDFVVRVKDALAKGTRQAPKTRARFPIPVPAVPALATSLAALVIGVLGVSVAAMYFFQPGPQAPVMQEAVVTEAAAVPPVLQPGQDKPQINVQVVYKNRLEPYDLDGSAWDIELVEIHTDPNAVPTVVKDRLKFKNKVLASSTLASSGFSPTRYTSQKHGSDVVVWKTIQKNADGSMVRWYGEWNGKTLKGFMTQHAAEGISREFSFTGVRIQG